MTPRTLAGRLTAWYAALLAVTLIGMAAIAVFVASQEDEAPGSLAAAIEGPDLVPRRLAIAFLAGLPPSLALAALGGVWITRRSLRPLSDIVAMAARLDAENLDARVAVSADAPAEIAALGRTLNEMLDRIERSVEITRRFTADASHELRTPLAALRTGIEVELRRPRTMEEMRESHARALRELERLSAMVESLLTLARADAGALVLSNEPVDLGALMRRAAEGLATTAAARGIRLQVETVEAWTRGDPALLARLASNLADNAIKFVGRGAGASGEVRLTTIVHDGRAELRVEDDGPGIELVDRPRVFERFYRGDAHRGSTDGAGLGLPLAQEIARRHGTEIELLASPLGGLLARVRLPRFDPSGH